MTTVTAIRELEATEVTVTCACGANAVVSDEDRESCLTCAIYQWMEPAPESIVQAVEERLCVECGGIHAPLYDEQTHCGLCVEAMTAEEYGASAMGTAGIEKAQRGAGDGVRPLRRRLHPHDRRAAPGRPLRIVRGPACTTRPPTGATTRRRPATRRSYRTTGDDPDYLYQQFDDIHGVPVSRAVATDLSRVVTDLLQPEDFMPDGAGYHDCVDCDDNYLLQTPGCLARLA